jgi:hypothetical protein
MDDSRRLAWAGCVQGRSNAGLFHSVCLAREDACRAPTVDRGTCVHVPQYKMQQGAVSHKQAGLNRLRVQQQLTL